MIYTVIDANTNEVLGKIEKFRKELPWNGRGMRPSRAWFCLVGDESISADTKSNIACYLAGKRKYKIISNNA